jgi:FixJ family two-component response regulator
VQAFKNHPAIEKAACIILDINLPDGSGLELRGLKSRRRFRAGYLHHRQ